MKCGNPDCQYSHGPYLYAYWKQDKKLKKRYLKAKKEYENPQAVRKVSGIAARVSQGRFQVLVIGITCSTGTSILDFRYTSLSSCLRLSYALSWCFSFKYRFSNSAITEILRTDIRVLYIIP